MGSWTRVSTAVRAAVEAALTRILTPKRSIDILREVRLHVTAVSTTLFNAAPCILSCRLHLLLAMLLGWGLHLAASR